ncbi:replication protein [Serratia sp. MF2]|uniref:replication protein n=1 Tax=Serratia sp. MF2 TaxID=3059173 RepID=UPI0027E61E98|nr:replication protein [Serratia sp. MF2]MDQ7100916.1 replication protein [Serratia sp. MF2]
MENQRLGYVPLYRSIKKKPWAKDVFLRTLWDNLLMEAARGPYTATFKGSQWNLEPGQLVVTTADLGLSLCDREGKPTSRDAVIRMLKFFVKEGMISMDGEKRKGTVITILNYAEYAEKIDDSPAHKAAHNPAHSKPSNYVACEVGAAHKAAHNPAHHEQEGNNKNINTTPLNPPRGKLKFDPGAVEIPEWLSPSAWHEWVQYRTQTKKPIKSMLTVAKAFNLLKECLDEGHDPVEIINASIANGYQGLFKPKFPIRKQAPTGELAPHWNSQESWEEFI